MSPSPSPRARAVAIDYAGDAAVFVKDLGEQFTRGDDSFMAIVDSAERMNDDGDVIGMEMRLTWAESDIALEEGDQITRGAETYTVREAMSDGHGVGYCKLDVELSD